MGAADIAVATAVDIRHVIARLLECEHSEAALERAREILTLLLEDLDGPPAASYWDDGEATLDERRELYLDHTPFGGRRNPVMPPPLSLDRVPDGDNFRIRSEVSFSRAFEGGPGMVHGGVISGLFDHFFGLGQGGWGAATVSLTVRYLLPTPLGQPLTFEVHYDDVDDRTLLGHGTCSAWGRVTAEAEGVFRKIDFHALGRRASTP